MVQHVERLRAKLQVQPLGQARVLERRNIQIRQPWALQDVPAGVAKGSRRRQRKGGGVHPVLRRSQVDALRGSARSEAGPVGIVCIPVARLIKPKYGSEGE